VIDASRPSAYRPDRNNAQHAAVMALKAIATVASTQKDADKAALARTSSQNAAIESSKLASKSQRRRYVGSHLDCSLLWANAAACSKKVPTLASRNNQP
jgi:hypothetical protein